MRRIKLFSLIPERVARFASGGSTAAESLEPRCLLAAGELDLRFGVAE